MSYGLHHGKLHIPASVPYVDEFLGIDDRDDTYDPEYRQDSHYCEPHGNYIGPPSGADIMCGECENECVNDDDSDTIAAELAGQD